MFPLYWIRLSAPRRNSVTQSQLDHLDQVLFWTEPRHSLHSQVSLSLSLSLFPPLSHLIGKRQRGSRFDKKGQRVHAAFLEKLAPEQAFSGVSQRNQGFIEVKISAGVSNLCGNNFRIRVIISEIKMVENCFLDVVLHRELSSIVLSPVVHLSKLSPLTGFCPSRPTCSVAKNTPTAAPQNS